jgi:transposase
MIKRKQYSLEYKESLVNEFLLGNVSLAELSKRENIAHSTLNTWIKSYESEKNSSSADASEIKRLKKKLAESEQALGEMALELHFLKKMEEYLQEQKRKKNSSRPISRSILASRSVVKS